MSQDVSTNPGVTEPLTTPPQNKPWSAEAEADKLMDDLFSDIDRILEGGSKLPTEPAKPEYVSLKSIVIPQITAPPVVVPPQELQQQSTLALTEDKDKPVEPTETEVAPAQPTTPAAKRSGWSVEKILLAGGIASLLVTLILLLTNSSKLSWPWQQNSNSPSSLKGQPAEADSQFASYMLRSLDVIDHKTKAKSKTATAPNSSSTANLPSIPVPSNRTLASNQSPNVLEKVYIPVPMPQAPVAPPASSPAARSLGAVAPSAARPPAPAPSAVAKPSALPKPPAPAPLQAIRLPTLALPKAIAPVVPPPPPPAVPKSPAPQVQAAVAHHTLVGLLELGDHSAALFDINGITQRINVGGSIGTSGWTLVSVDNQEAVIRRNGEVRSVYIGQKF